MATDDDDIVDHNASPHPPDEGTITINTTKPNIEKEKRETELQQEKQQKEKSAANNTNANEDMETDEINNHNIRFIIKHKKRSTINVPELLQAFIEEATQFDPKMKFYNHHQGNITSKNFPFGEDFNQQFDGGQGETPGVYSERLFNGNTTVTWINIKTTLTFIEIREKTQAWLKPNKIYLDTIRNNYFGPREVIGQIFGLSTKYTHRDGLLKTINHTLNPDNNPTIQVTIKDDDDIDIIKKIPYKPEIKLAPIYARDNNETMSCMVHWIIAPQHSDTVFTEKLMKHYEPQHKHNIKFLPKGAYMEINETIKNMVKSQNELNDNITTIPIVKLITTSLDITLTKRDDEGKEYKFTSREFLNSDNMFISIEQTKNTPETGLHHFICKKKNITKAWSRIDSWIALYQELNSPLNNTTNKFNNDIPSRSKTDQKRQPQYQKVTSHFSYKEALTKNTPVNDTGPKRMPRQRIPPTIVYDRQNQNPTISDATSSNKQPINKTFDDRLTKLEATLTKICNYIDKVTPEHNKVYTSPAKTTPKQNINNKHNQNNNNIMEAFLQSHPHIQQQYNEFAKENNPQKQLFMTPVQTFNDYNKMNITTFLQPDYDPTKMDVDEPETIKRKAEEMEIFLIENANILNEKIGRLKTFRKELQQNSPASQRQQDEHIS